MQKLLAFTLVLIILSACTMEPLPAPTSVFTQPPPATSAPAAAQSLSLSSPAFANGQPIPQKFSCQGDNVSPALAWSGVPAAARSLALVVEDPDAPGSTVIHWVIYNIPPSLTGLPEKVLPGSQVEGIGTQGPDSSGTVGFTGPCPPSGSAHHYYFRLYALDLNPDLPAGLSADGLQQQMSGHILAQAEWMGTYQSQ